MIWNIPKILTLLAVGILLGLGVGAVILTAYEWWGNRGL